MCVILVKMVHTWSMAVLKCFVRGTIFPVVSSNPKNVVSTAAVVMFRTPPPVVAYSAS